MKPDGVESIKDLESIKASILEYLRNNPPPKVVIRCIAYNQGNYISDCLNGFVSQNTAFPFAAIVHDDASPDNTAEIISDYGKRFPNTIIAICDKVNRYSTHSLSQVMDLLVDMLSPEYVAFCEGDDYWSDPQKLQKQVDYMDEHPECVMTHGDYGVINGNKKKTPKHYDDEPYFGPGHLHTYTICSLTVLYRYDAYKRIPHDANSQKWLMGDYPLWIELSREGSFHYMPEILGMYRLLPNSASHSTNCEKIKQFWNCRNDITRFYSNKYNFEYHPKPQKALYDMIQTQCYNNHDKIQAKKYWQEAKQLSACSAKSFIYYISNIYSMNWLINLIYKVLGKKQ